MRSHSNKTCLHPLRDASRFLYTQPHARAEAPATHPFALGCELSAVWVQPSDYEELVALAIQCELNEVVLLNQLLNVIPSLLKNLRQQSTDDGGCVNHLLPERTFLFQAWAPPVPTLCDSGPVLLIRGNTSAITAKGCISTSFMHS
jgi:hypothetical protein